MQKPFVVAVLVAAVAAILMITPSGTAPAVGAAPSASGNWLSWGRTLDQTRHSPLRQITRANIGRLGRVFNVDFRAIDGTMLRGQQAYPLIVNGRIYVTTADNNVFALDGTTGRVIWRYKPANTALFANFGIRANRGVAYCGGRLFLATLDMHLVALNAATGRLLARVPVDSAVPGASSNYGYGQTSAPICAKGRVLMGAAGSEYGIRGFVMAWRTNLTPAWANPYWTIPPPQSEWRKRGRLVGGGAVWTPVAVDSTTNTVYFGTGSATPLYQPSLRPGPAPRTDSLIAVDLMTGRQKWWRQQMARNEWAYDTAQPPLVYNARVGGKRRRIVSVATMEGVWFAYDARTGTPIYQRVKVLDRVEHPALKPGQPVAVFPGPIGGLNYSPASYDPATNLIINAAAETAGVLIQDKLTPTQKQRKLVGDIFTRSQERRVRHAAARLAKPRLDQRDRRQHGSPGLEVPHARTRTRRRDDDRERPRIRRRRRRRAARVRDAHGQGALDVPDRLPDCGRPVDLQRRRQAVHRDHRRRNADVLQRRHWRRGCRCSHSTARSSSLRRRPTSPRCGRPQASRRLR